MLRKTLYHVAYQLNVAGLLRLQ